MVLKSYSPEILRMIYLLSVSRKKLIGKELEDYLSSKLDGISTRTIHRWIKFARSIDEKERTFDYYPSIRFSSFDLIKVEVVLKNPRDPRVLRSIPHLYWAGISRDRDFNEVLILHYLIPPKAYTSLYAIFEDLKGCGIFDEMEMYMLKRGLFIPSPFHEVVSEDGELVFEKPIDNTSSINGFAKDDVRTGLKDEVRLNPVLIPLIFESDKESSPYEMIWNEVKRRLGDRLPEFYPGRRVSFPDDGGQGSIYIQRIFRDVNASFDDYYDHIRVYYKPFYEIRNIQMFNLILKFEPERMQEMLRVLVRISERCLFLTSYLTEAPGGMSMFRINLQTTFDQFFTVMKWLKQTKAVFDFTFVDRQKSWLLWDRHFTKFAYWDLFDPRTMTWRFDGDAYRERARSLFSTR